MKALSIILIITTLSHAYNPENIALNLGITIHDYNFYMAMIGFAVGAVFFLLMTYVALHIGGRK